MRARSCRPIDQRLELVEVVEREPQRLSRRAVGRPRPATADRLVECGNPLGKEVDVARGQCAPLDHSRQQSVRRKLAHADRPFDGFAGAAGDESALALDDWNDVDVQRRRRPPVQRDLDLAIPASRRERREVEEREPDRLLDLVRVVAGQKHVRDVGLDDLDRAALRAERGRIAQAADHAALVDLHRGAFASKATSGLAATRVM